MNFQKYYFDFAGKKISPVGYGTVKIGRNQNVKNKSADGFRLPTVAEVKKTLQQLQSFGVNVIDTAPAYGVSEEVVGKAIEHREDFFISSKVGEEFDGQSSQYDFSKSHIMMSIERSLKRFKTDYLDSVMVHCPREDLDVLQNSPALETLANLKLQGKINSFGASTNSIDGGKFAVKYCDSVMISFNILYQAEIEIIKEAISLNKHVFIKKGLLQGHLDKVQLKNPVYECFKGIYQISPMQTVIFGTNNSRHIEENCVAALSALNELVD